MVSREQTPTSLEREVEVPGTGPAPGASVLLLPRPPGRGAAALRGAAGEGSAGRFWSLEALDVGTCRVEVRRV